MYEFQREGEQYALTYAFDVLLTLGSSDEPQNAVADALQKAFEAGVLYARTHTEKEMMKG